MNEKKIKKIIGTHALVLLQLYGVEEKYIKEHPDKLFAFVELLFKDLNKIYENNNNKRRTKSNN